MSETRCSECGATVDLDGTCPECLLALGLLSGPRPVDDRIEEDPESIGPYRVVERLGEGGMGVVYLAEQQEPIRRRVAVKVIKLGMDSKEVISRFQAERQALALMDHPGIARVFDAGATREGRPYFVMEHVEGVPITDYCDEKRMGTDDRVRLFVEVCRAAEHAHRRGVIHRDLKPSNVLVSEIDGKPVAKIIDFGVAKATAQRLAERTVFTELGRILGTPEYMSPEQAEGGGLDVDTRTDVYSLGVLLYELLVGFLPFEPRELRKAGIRALLRAIREHESLRPSRRISSVGEGSIEKAKQRRTDPASLARHLRDDLDWIVMRAIDKDRERRYSGASEFSADLERYLNHEPVLAGPPGAGYRLRKFARKHRVAVTATAVVLLAIGSVVASYTVRLRAQRDRAEREAAKARQVVAFLKGLFEGADPRETAGVEPKVSDLLERGAQRLDADLVDQPATQAEIAGLLGEIYTALGNHEQARVFLERALERYTETVGENHREVAITLRNLGRLDYKESRHDDAERRLRRAMAIVDALDDGIDADTAVLGRDLGVILAAGGDLSQGIAECERALALVESLPDVPGAVLVESTANCGYLLLLANELERAEPMLERGLELAREVLGPRHPDLAYHLDYVAQVRRRLGNVEGAEAVAREGLRVRTEALGEKHPQTVESMYNVGVLLTVKGDLDGALRLYRETLATRREILGNEHRQVALNLYSIATILERRDELDEARAMYEEAAAIQRSALGPAHYAYGRTRARLGAIDLKQGRPESAEAILRDALDIVSNALPEDHPERSRPLLWLGWTLVLSGRPERAEELLRQALEIRRSGLPEGSLQIPEAELALASCLARLGRRDEASGLLEASYARLAEALDPGAWLLRQAEATRGLLE